MDPAKLLRFSLSLSLPRPTFISSFLSLFTVEDIPSIYSEDPRVCCWTSTVLQSFVYCAIECLLSKDVVSDRNLCFCSYRVHDSRDNGPSYNVRRSIYIFRRRPVRKHHPITTLIVSTKVTGCCTTAIAQDEVSLNCSDLHSSWLRVAAGSKESSTR